ncbi:unnamed protein product, partial [Symbiodinium microadriaticum]
QRSHPVDALDKILGAEGVEFTKAELKNIYVPEHLWETRFMRGKDRGNAAAPYRTRSSPGEVAKTDLLQIARANVEKSRHVEKTRVEETMREKWQRAISLVIALNAAKRNNTQEDQERDDVMYSKWKKHPMDNLKDVMDAKRNILKTYQDAMDTDPSTSKYMDGRKKSSKASRFRLGNAYDKKLQNDPNVHESVVVDADMAELVKWKQYCLHSTQSTKNGPERTLPVLANRGSHSLYWGKQIVSSDGKLDDSDPSLLLHSLRKLTS